MSRIDDKRFEALGQNWIARLDFNATCAIEEETGESFYTVSAPFLEQIDAGDAGNPAKVLQALGGRHNSRIRLILFHALLGQHPDVTLDQTGVIIGAIGLQEATAVVLWAIARGLGADLDAADGEDAGNVKRIPAAGNRTQRKAAAKAG